MMKTKQLLLFTIGILFSLMAVPSSQADAIFTVTLDTTALMGSPSSDAGPFSLAFQLTDGSGVNDGNNTATISGFNLGGGSVTGSYTALGNTSVGSDGQIVLTDSEFLNLFMQGFTPGSSLSFTVDISTNVDSDGAPDFFGFILLDSSGMSIPTIDESLGDMLLAVNIDSANPEIWTYATDPSRNTLGGNGPAIDVGGPGR
jgi:hypothetical protein